MKQIILNIIKPVLVIAVAILFFSSCMVGPKFQKPETEVPINYIYDSVPDTVINLRWWEIFKDEKLVALIDTALLRNQDLLIAASRVQEAAYIVGYNKADIWPSLGYSGTAQYGNMGIGGSILESEGASFMAGANLFWELDFWGKFRRSTEAAKAQMVASQHGMRTVQISLISNVSTLYFQLIDYKKRLEISQETLESRIESTRIIGERFDKGIVPEIDYNQAQVQEAIAAASVPVWERNVATTEHALAVLLGGLPQHFESNLLLDQEVDIDIPTDIPSELLTRRPDIMQAEELYRSANANIGVAQAMRFPAISLTGILGAASTDLSSLATGDAVVWSAAGGITGPIFQFGKNKRRVEIERERTTQAYLNYKKTVLNAFADVEDALVRLSTVKREIEALNKQFHAAQNAAKLSRSRYDGGVTSYLEVLETERSLFESELKTADAYQRLLSSYSFLYKALGGGWISEEEELASKETSAE